MLIVLKLDYSHLMSVAEAIYYLISFATGNLFGSESECLYSRATPFWRILSFLFHICLV